MFDMSEFQEWNLPEEEAAFLGEWATVGMEDWPGHIFISKVTNTICDVSFIREGLEEFMLWFLRQILHIHL